MKPVNLFNLLQECTVEKNVESKYHEIFKHYFPKAIINSPFRTDGILYDPETGIKILIETKYSVDMNSKTERNKLLVQGVYYLKNLEKMGEELPSILFCGDIDECFFVHVNNLIPLLNLDLDWSLPPSVAPLKNPDLLITDIYTPFVEHINNDHFDFGIVVQKIIETCKGIIQKIRITELNINRFFHYFKDRVIIDQKKLTPNQLVNIFLGCLIESENFYIHPKKKNILVTPFGEIRVNQENYIAFFNKFESSYSIAEKQRLTSICDRLIEDETRRFKGEFYTPTEWVIESHKLVSEVLGPNWYEEYVVWDPAWGTGNLTRDFKFKELYCSTINHGDLEIGKNYNPEAIKFQYDFLNDDIVQGNLLQADGIKKLPDKLFNRLFTKKDKNSKKILFYLNPPFGTCGEVGMTGESKAGIAKTKINEHMILEKIGHCSQQLYAQFLYRILQYQKINKNIYVAFFSPSLFFTGPSYKKFRQQFLENFSFLDGFMFNAGYFADVSSYWAIAFSIWAPGKNDKSFILDIKEYDENGVIKSIAKKQLHNTDNQLSLTEWAKSDIKNLKRYDAPYFSNAISVKNRGGGRMCDNALGYFSCAANNVITGLQKVYLLTSSSTAYYGFPFTEDNFMKVVSAFTARVSTILTFYNYADEYLAPNTNHPDYEQWNNDAIVYSLFHKASQQSSVRKITYKDKEWDIKNEFFWMSNQQMLELAEKYDFDELYHDARGDHDRFVYRKLQQVTLSEDAREVLTKAVELVEKSFPYRKALHEEHPEWYLQAWDAGWYQVKLILKLFLKDDLQEFYNFYRKFEQRMREGVYKFGFLK